MLAETEELTGKLQMPFFYTRGNHDVSFSGGMGAEKFKVLIVFSNGKLGDRAVKGTLHYEAGAEAVAGKDSAEAATSKSGQNKGYKAFKLNESGVCVRVTIRVAQARTYLKD
jgi:hypothetical protein